MSSQKPLRDDLDARAITQSAIRNLPSCAALVELERGLHVLDISGTESPSTTSIHVSSTLDATGEGVTILTDVDSDGPWLPGSGGIVVVKSPSGRGGVMVTVYADTGVTTPRVPQILMHRLDHDADVVPPAVMFSATSSAAAEVRTEIVLHIERMGDRQFAGEGWVGNRGKKLQIEAFSIRPSELLTARDIQFRAFGPNGRETPWVTDGNLCGTRGRGIPLTGFAVRLAPNVSNDYEVIYQGAFFESGASNTCRNGDPCKAAIADEPLEAICVRIVRRGLE